jgi:hypothetical protein
LISDDGCMTACTGVPVPPPLCFIHFPSL